MTAKEMRSEIQKALDKASEDTLEEVLNYLKLAEGKSADKRILAKNLGIILREDKTLLERLAQ